MRISGCVAHPSQSRSNNRMQYLFLNGRHIRDHALQHALGEAYRGLLMVGRYAIAFLSIEMPPDMVDVNVHPTKLEVRFRDGGRLYSQLLSTLRSKFLTTDLTTQAQAPPGYPIAGGADPSGAHDETRAAQLRQELVDWAKGKVAAWQQPGQPATSGSGCRRAVGPQRAAEAILVPHVRPGRRAPAAGTDAAGHAPARFSPAAAPAGSAEGFVRGDPAHVAGHGTGPSLPAAGPCGVQALQIHNRYLVTETQEGVTIIDQHALHERILFEQLRRGSMPGPWRRRICWCPRPVDLSPAEAAIALEHRDVLGQLGLRIEPFGGDTVLITGFPAMLANMNPGEILHALLERLVSGGGQPDRRDLLDDMLHTVACKAAIKAGDRLTAAEIAALLEQRHTVDDSHHCPHGRPTELVFTREELDKQFKRV